MARTVLRGIPASPGQAKGKVKIVSDPSQCKKVKRGDILVTWMTNPLFLPAMRRASAIVTDIGGLLCHAAIVSRELKIPCIVNTGKATSILKNGQKIFVDASKGEIYRQ